VTIRNIKSAISRFESEGVEYDSHELQQSVERYKIERFNQEMQEAVDYAAERSRIAEPTPVMEPPKVEP